MAFIRPALPLALLALTLAACQKKPVVPSVTPPPPPPPPTALQLGEKHFEAGNYAEAARQYEKYLRESPANQNQDRALFQLALVRGIAGHSEYSPEQSPLLLQQFVNRFPRSPLKPLADLILALEVRVAELRTLTSKNEAARRETAERLRRVEEDLRIQKMTILSLQTELDKAKAGVRERDERIRERDERLKTIREELDALKKIDLERRPTRPPPPE